MLLLLGLLALGWYGVEPTIGVGGAIRTPLPEGSPNPAPMVVLVVLVALAMWPWVKELQRRRELR
jgi:hypothetical protein